MQTLTKRLISGNGRVSSPSGNIRQPSTTRMCSGSAAILKPMSVKERQRQSNTNHMLRIGLISDTHHFLDENVFRHFDACDEIWHAGDFALQTWPCVCPLLNPAGSIRQHRRTGHPEHLSRKAAVDVRRRECLYDPYRRLSSKIQPRGKKRG